MNIAENIVRLRKNHGMTQEALAEVVGVSPQTISKWENSTTYPDVSLLPVLADVFGVTIDALYGRESAINNVTQTNAVDHVIEQVRETFVATVFDPELDGRFEDHLAQYKKVMQSDPRQRSVIQNDRDVLYFREKLGALALRKPDNGWSSLFIQGENLEILRMLADVDFRKAMHVIISRRMLRFTVSSLAKQASVEDTAQMENLLQDSGLFAKQELMIDEKPLVYYELTQGETKLYLLYAVLAFAQELRTYEGMHYCFIGSSQYFTP